MKITKLLFAILLFIPLFQSCQNDISNLDDPRDAIAKKWRVTDNSGSYAGTHGYDVTITKDANESTQVLFTNFHDLGSADKLKATISGSILTIVTPNNLDGTYVITGTGTISNDLKTITFNYSVKAGADPAESFVGTFGEVITVKKKVAKPAL
jgi:hypothetical protein